MANSTVNIITNPENTLAFDSNGKAVENGIPEYQNFVPYVELYAVRNEEVKALMTSKGSILITSGSDTSKLVSFMGYKTSDDNKNNQYTAGYTDYIGGTPEEYNNLDEGFGITDIDVDIKSKLVPQVTIKFVDVKGASFFNSSEESKNSYRVLFDFEPPIFVLLLKGVFGETTRYELHLLSTNTKFDSSTGNFIVTAKFVGKTFAPLSDIRLGWLKTASFLNKPQSLLSLNNTGPVDSYFELITRGRNYYNDIKALVDDKEEKTKIDNENSKLSNLNSLEQYFFQQKIYINRPKEDIKYINTPIYEKNGTITGILSTSSGNITNTVTNSLSNQSNILEPLYNQIFFSFLVNDTDLTSINNADVLDLYYKSLINKHLNGYGNLDITYDAGDVYMIKTIESGFIKYHLVLTKFYEKIFKNKQSVNKVIDENNKKIKDKLDKSIVKNLGFDPTIGNIFDIILDDATIFMNALKNAGTVTHDAVKDQILDKAAFPRVVKTQVVDGVSTQVNDYPGNYPEFKGWGEVQFVENFINTYIAVKKYENELEASQANDTQGISKMIPCGIFDLENKDLNYFNNNLNLDDIFTTLFKRYTLSTQYSYKGKLKDVRINDTNVADGAYLIKFIANSEAENLIASVYDVKLLKLIKNYVNNVNETNFIKSFNTLSSVNTFLHNGLNGNTVSNRSLYSNNNTNYKGLIEIDKPNIITNDDLENEEPLKFYGGVLNTPTLSSYFFSDRVAKKTNTNLLLLPDTVSNNNITESLFFDGDFVDKFATAYKRNTETSQPDLFTSLQLHKEIILKNIYDYFNLPIIVEIPNFVLIYIGEIISNKDNPIYGIKTYYESTKLINLSDNDKKFFTDKYDTYRSRQPNYKIELDRLLNQSKGNIDNFIGLIKTSTFYKDMFPSDKDNGLTYITNDTSFTFLDPNGSSPDYNPSFEVLVNQDNTFNDKWLSSFWNVFKSNIIPKLDEKIKVNEEQNKDIESNIKDNELKIELYYSFKTFYDRWLKNNYFDSTTTTFFKDKFSYVDRAFNDISKKAYIDFSTLLDYDSTPSTELYGALSTMLSHNNFEFFPLPNFINYKEDANGVVDTGIWQKIFNVNPSVNLNQKPAFICMYVGGYSSQNDKEDVVKFSEATQTATDFGDSVFSFNINFGIQNQTIFNNIDIDTTEIKETGESLRLIDEIFKKKDSGTPILQKQNLFNVYEQRAYSCTVTIPFGNTCIQPTTYFELKNVPMFNGVYIILEVSHKINSSSNKLETTFKGTRIRRYIVPYISNPIMSVFGTSADIVKQQNNTPINYSAIPNYNPNSFWIRKDSSQTKNIVRYVNGKYIKI
jgi:hypothetical protein